MADGGFTAASAFPNTPPSSVGGEVEAKPRPSSYGSAVHVRNPSTSTVHERSSLAAAPYDPDQQLGVITSRAETIKLHRRKSFDIDDYFAGPLDPNRHSRLPYWMRVHGSIVPKLIIPLLFIGGWAAMITLLHKKVHSLSVNNVLLTVLGFVVGLALSFRVSSANERYMEGRKYWANIVHNGRLLAHHIWIHAKERGGEYEKIDLLNKLSAINLIMAFAVATKHKLRHEIEYDYADMKHMIENLDTFAKKARTADEPPRKANAALKRAKTWGEYLGVPFVMSNPKKAYKKAALAGRHHGNLPFEIFNHMGGYMSAIFQDTYQNGPMQSQAYACLTQLMDAYTGCERVLETPLPLAYNIVISQITWLYVLVLPFQMVNVLGYITIPATAVAAYIILGLAAIGREIEDPFGRDVNDLDLDRYCESLQSDLNILTSKPACRPEQEFMLNDLCKPLYPVSLNSYASWNARSVADIRSALSSKVDHRAVQMANGEVPKSNIRVESDKVRQDV